MGLFVDDDRTAYLLSEVSELIFTHYEDLKLSGPQPRLSGVRTDS